MIRSPFPPSPDLERRRPNECDATSRNEKHSSPRVMKKKVAVFRSELLPLSETFIRAQAQTLTHWAPTLFGFETVANGLDLSALDQVIVSRGGRFRSALHYWTRRANTELTSHLREHQLVHAHFGIGAVEIWPSVRAARLPMVVTLHGNDISICRSWWESGAAGLRKRVYPRRLLQMAHEPAVHFLAVSAAIRQRAIDYGIPAEKVTVCHIGVDTNTFLPGGEPIPERRNQILFVGRMVEKKAPDILVRAFAKVREHVKDAELTMIGEGPRLNATVAIAHQLSVPVTFLGSRSSGDILTALHKSKVFCLPSVTAPNGDAEGLPIALLEAQACGVPVVTSSKGGLGETVLPGVTGEFFEEGDEVTLAEHLARLLIDSDYAQLLSINARTLVENKFNLSTCSLNLETHYDRQIKFST